MILSQLFLFFILRNNGGVIKIGILDAFELNIKILRPVFNVLAFSCYSELVILKCVLY